MFHFFKRKMPKPEERKEESNTLSSQLQDNIKLLNELFSADINRDFKCRQLIIHSSGKKCALFFYSSIVNATKIYEAIIQPLSTSEDTELTSMIIAEEIEELEIVEDVVLKLNRGHVILIINGENKAFAINTADFQHRGIEKPENESVIKGPKEAFTESTNVNLSLIRKRFYNHQLIAEKVLVGNRSRLTVTVVYLKDVANKDTLENVKKRIQQISADNVREVEQLEQYIEERPKSLVPTLLYTERPDRATGYIEDGHIALMMDNSSAALILPVTFWSFFHTVEDHYLRFLFGNFSRLIRMMAFFITLFISSIYIAITTFHSEMIPPDLLLAIASSREKVPFPVIVEVLIMELAFELIREAGSRIPSTLGPTIGIVGALILGQAAVEANIISPIIVIVAALSGLSSFAISDVGFNYSIRISRFLFIFASTIYGMYSLAGCFIVWLMYLTTVKSFGVPFLSPLAPHYKSSGDTLFRKLLKREEWRPQNIHPQDVKKK